MTPSGVVLFDQRDDDDVVTPTESVAAPEHYHDASNRFMAPSDRPEPQYPDEDKRCAVLRQPTTQILVAAVLGGLFGALLSHLGVSSEISALVSLPGSIFLQVLKCFVLPMIFTSLTTGVADLVHIGNMSSIGTRTAALFLGLSTVASILSMGISAALYGLNDGHGRAAVEVDTAFLGVECANAKFWAANASTGAVTCSGDSAMTLEMVDLTGVILGDATASAATGVSEQITGILHELLPSNIFESFQSGTLLSVITFSVVFGAAAVKVSNREHSPLLAVLAQMNQVFFIVIRKLIDWSPLFVLSLVAGSLSSQSMLTDAVAHVGILVLSLLLSVIIFELACLPLLIWLLVRANPLRYARAMAPAALFAFGCASSLATLPVTLRCVENTREVPRGLLHFVVTLGCSAHKNGSAMYYPAAMVFLASTAAEELPLGWWEVSLGVFVSLLGSVGTAPITNASLVVVYSVWQSVYPDVPMPASFSYLVAIDWLLDRFVTACNVLGDAYVARILAEQVDETYDVDGANADRA